MLLSRNSADTGLRIFNSIEHYGLPITRAAFCGGESPWRYIQAFGCHLFLSSESADVRKALENNLAAATLVSKLGDDSASPTIRFAFDGAHGLAMKARDRRSSGSDASASGLLAATLHTVAHIAVFSFHVAFDRTVAHMGWR